ncbi:MAG: hypothetical protein VW274_05805, partial [Thalassolituus sp.]
ADGPVDNWWYTYLKHLGADDLKLVIKAAPVRTNVISSPGGVIERKFEQTRRVLHESLGEGTVIGEDSEYLRVRFDGEVRIRKLAMAAVADKIRRL